MSEEAEGGIDKQGLLAEVAGVPLPIPPLSPVSSPESSQQIPVFTAPPSRWSRWSSYRHELSAIACAFVSVIWLAVGLASSAWTPCLIGAAFGVVALAIWAADAWARD